jgi:transposase
VNRHARILLKADVASEEGGWTDAEISTALDVSVATIERLRQRFVEAGLAACLERRQTRVYQRLLDGVQEAHLIALTCSDPPRRAESLDLTPTIRTLGRLRAC